MTISQRGQIVQLRSGGPLLTAVSLPSASGKARCVWFAPGRAIAESAWFAVDTLHCAPKLCREGGLWARWRSEANKRKLLLGANQIWLTAEPWWLAEPDPETDGDFEDEEWDEEEAEDFEDLDRDTDDDDDSESFDLNSENFARSHAEGWYYDDDGTDVDSSDEADSDEDEEEDDDEDEEDEDEEDEDEEDEYEEDEAEDDDEDDEEEDDDVEDDEEDEDNLEDDEG